MLFEYAAASGLYDSVHSHIEGRDARTHAPAHVPLGLGAIQSSRFGDHKTTGSVPAVSQQVSQPGFCKSEEKQNNTSRQPSKEVPTSNRP